MGGCDLLLQDMQQCCGSKTQVSDTGGEGQEVVAGRTRGFTTLCLKA